MTDAKTPPEKTATATKPQMDINWDDSGMESQYANIATATANREEFFLLFGTHQHWKGGAEEAKAVNVHLSNRVVMGPHAAKRLSMILAHSVQTYEKQFGGIEL